MADYLSVSEVARLLSISEQELRSRCERKELTAQFRDGEWRIASGEMDRLKSEFGDPFASLMALGGDDFDFGSPPPAPGPAEAGSGMEISMSNLNQDLPDPLGGLGGGDDFFGGGVGDFGAAPAAEEDDYSAGDDAGRKSIFDEMMEDEAPADVAPAIEDSDNGLFGGGAMTSFPADAAAFAVDQEAGEIHPPEISDSFMSGGGLDDLDSLMGMTEEVAATPPPALAPIHEMVPPGSKSSQKSGGASEPSAADWDIDDENVPPPGLPTDMDHGTAWTDSLLMESEIELTNSAEPVSKVDTFNPLHDPEEVEAALGEMAAAGLGPMNMGSAVPAPEAPVAETPVAETPFVLPVAETPVAETPFVLPVGDAFSDLPETVEMAALPVEPAAEPISPIAETFEPAAEAFEPAADDVFEPAADDVFAPAGEAFEPVAETLEPAGDVFAPAAEAFDPLSETVEPVAETFEPAAETADAFEPAAEAFEPAAEAFEPADDVFAPAGEAFEPVAETLEPAGDVFAPAAEAFEPAAEAVEPLAVSFEPAAETPAADAPAVFAAAEDGNELFRDSGLTEAWVASPEAIAPQAEPSSFMAAPDAPAVELAQSSLGTGWEGNLFDSGLRESAIPEEPSFPPMPEASAPHGDDDNAMFRESTLPGEGWQTAEIVADAAPAPSGAIDSALAGSLLVESFLPEGPTGTDVPPVGPIRTLAAALDEVPLPASAVDTGESSWTNSPLTESALPDDDALTTGDSFTHSDALSGTAGFTETAPPLSAADAATLSADLGRPAEMPLTDADEISGISTMTPAPPVNESTELSPLHETGFSGSLLEAEDDDFFPAGNEAAEAQTVPFPAAGSGLSAFADDTADSAEEAAGMDLTGMLDEEVPASFGDDVPKETLEFTAPPLDSDVLEIALTGDEAGSLVQVEEVQEEEELDELPADDTSDEPMQLEEAFDEGPIRLYGGDDPAVPAGEPETGEVAMPTLRNTADAFEGDIDDSISLTTGSGLLAEADVLSGDLDLGEGAMQTLKGPTASLGADEDDGESIQLSANDEDIFGGGTTIGTADSGSQLDYHADDADVLGGNLDAGEGAMQTLKGSSSAFGAEAEEEEEIELSTGDDAFFGGEAAGVSASAAADDGDAGAEIELSTADDNFFGSDLAGSAAPTAGADFGEADFGAADFAGMDLGQPGAFGQPAAFASGDFGGSGGAFGEAGFGDADVLGANLDAGDGGMQTLKGSLSGFRQADEEQEIPISAADDMFGGDSDVLGGDLEVAEGGMQTVKGPMSLFGTGDDDEEVELSGEDAHSLDEPVGGELGDSEIMGPNDEDYQGAIEIETPMESEPNEPQFGTVLTDDAEAADINTMHTMQGSAEDLLGLGNRVTLSAKGIDESASVLGDNLDLEDSDDKGTFTGSREKLAAMGDRIEVSASDAADSDSNVVEIAAPDSGAGILDEDLDLLGADDSSSQTVVGRRPVPAATYGDDDDENPQIDMSAMDDGSGSSNEYDPSGQTMVGQLPNMGGKQQVQLRSGEEDEADSDVRVTPGGYADESDVRMAPGNTAMDSSMEVVPLDDASGSSQELLFSSGDSAIRKRDDADALASYRSGDPAASPSRNLTMGLPDESSSMSIDLDKEMQLEPDIDLAAGAGDFDLAAGVAEGGIEKTIDFGLAPALSGDDEPLTLGDDDDTAAQFAAAAAQLEDGEQDPSSMTAEAAVLGVPEADAGSSLSFTPDTGTSGFGFGDASDDGADDLVLSGSGASDITLNPSASGIGIGGSQSGLALERSATSGVDLDKDFGGATVVSANLPSDDNDFLIPDVGGSNDDSNLSSSIVALEGELGDINEGAPTNVGIDLGPMLGAEQVSSLGAAGMASSVNLGPQSGIGLSNQPSSVGLGGMPSIGIGSGLGQPMASGLGQAMPSGMGYPQSSSMNIQASSIGAPMASGVGYGNQPYGQPAYGGQPTAGGSPSYLPGQRIVLPPPEIAFTGADLALVLTPTVFLLLGGLFMFQLTLFNGGQWHGVWEFSQSLVDAIGRIGT